MTSLTIDPDLSSNVNIVLVWTTPTTGADTGGDGVSIIDYEIQVAIGAGAFSVLTTETGNTYDYDTPALTGGESYHFIITARNLYGQGAPSATMTSIAG